jgi:predicted Ser/Thr protein kinase
MSNSTRTCPQCGAVLPSTAGAGLCPSCLLREGIGSRIESQLATEVGSSASRKARPDAPSLEEIRGCFPQLEIVELLGQGGMGVVYLARQPQLDRYVALKILPDEAGRDPAFAERFTREAKTLARLNHPNIVSVYDFGQAGGHYFLTMEFVDGMNLRQLEQTKRVTPEEALVIIPKICDALQFAHEEGVVHRDIKPGNILIDKKGRVKIADFGLAKLLGHEQKDLSLTGDQAVMGTPHYMAPEQMTSTRTVDHRADIYSLGVVIYEMLTGELPVGRFAVPSKKVQVDVRLDEIVLKALESDPELRYQRVNEVRSQLDSISYQISQLPPHLRRMLGFDYKSKRTWRGLPLLHVSSRLDPVSGKCLEARGVLAFGAKATGIFAFGGRARGFIACGGIAQGVFAVGGVAMGVFTCGGVALALLLAMGGISVGAVSLGGVNFGLLAYGAGISAFPVAGPEAGPLAEWLRVQIFGGKLPIIYMIVSNLCWAVPTALLLIFQRRLQRLSDEAAGAV